MDNTCLLVNVTFNPSNDIYFCINGEKMVKNISLSIRSHR